MTMRSHEFHRRAIDVLGAERVARIYGVKVASAYRLARHPADDEDPDGTGARNPLDRIADLQDALAAYPEGRALLVEWKTLEDSQHARRLGAGHRQRYSVEAVARKLASLSAEFSDVVRECGQGAHPTTFCAQRLKREAAECIAELQDLMHEADAWAEQAASDTRIEPHPRTLRAG